MKERVVAFWRRVSAEALRIWDSETVREIRSQGAELYAAGLVRVRRSPKIMAAWGKALSLWAAHCRSLVISVTVVAVVAAGWLGYGIWRARNHKDVRVVRADVFVAKPVMYRDALAVMGLVRGGDSVDIAFQVAGVVAQVPAHEGSQIRKGDLIAALDDTDARLKVEYNESKVNAAEQKVIVHKNLFVLKSIIEAKLKEVMYEYESQKKELDFARRELEKTRLLAPVDGVVGPIDVEVGESVTQHSKVASVFNVRSVYVDIGIIEKDIGKIRLGQKVSVSVDAYAGVVKDATVTAISPVIEGKSRNFKVTARIEDNSGASVFMPGMFARADIDVFSQDKIIVVPLVAIKDGVVFVVEDGVAKKRVIKTGYRSYDYAVVLDGLKGGETVVAEPEGSFDDEPQVEVVNSHEYKESAK